MSDLLNGIPRVNPASPPTVAQRAVGRVLATTAGSVFHRRVFAPLDTLLIRLTRGRLHSAKGAVPLVLLRTIGAKSGIPRDVMLAYYTDGEDVILIASNYGQEKHPSWYYNLLKNPRCELFADGRADSGGAFVARSVDGADHDRLFASMERYFPNFTNYASTTAGIRTIPVLRLTPDTGDI